MRLISQNRRLDYSYEQIMIQNEGVSIQVKTYDSRDLFWFLFGTYDSREEARAVMNQILRAYADGKRFYVLPTSEQARNLLRARKESERT